MELKDILARLKAENGYTTQLLSEASGVPKGTLNKLLNGETTEPRRTTLRLLADALHCPVEWLTDPGANDPASGKGAIASAPNDRLLVRQGRVPVLGDIAAGQPIYAQQDYDEYVACGDLPRCDFALRVQGDSMIGARILDGDIVFIRAQEDVDDGQIAAVLVDQTATLKYVYHGKNEVRLVSANPKYPTMIFNAENCDSVRILGLAVAFQSLL